MRRRRANEAIERLSAKHAIEEKERTGQASAGARNFNQSSKDELKSSKLSTLSNFLSFAFGDYSQHSINFHQCTLHLRTHHIFPLMSGAKTSSCQADSKFVF